MTPNLRQVGRRLKEYMQTRGLSIESVSRMSPFSRQELDAMVDGGKYPVSRLMLLLSTFNDLNPEWLFKGESPMLLRGAPKPKREFRDDMEAREVLKRLSAVPPANPELRQQVTILEAEVNALKGLVNALATRLAELENAR
jgi:hypothetical protein